MNVCDLALAMEKIAPLRYAESWDRVGLLVGDRARPIEGPIVLTIDLTEKVLAEAVEMSASALVAYHPPIWQPMARLTDATPSERIIRHAVESRIAIYCPHTALDATPGGVTDWLCEGISGSGVEGKIAGDCRAITPAADATQETKIVTFLPLEKADTVRSALASAGAGIIGNYTVCSFGVRGEGTFLAGDGARPVIGEAGRLERADEVRLEMVCAKRALPLALATLRQFHPYEEPAIDIYELSPKPERRAGAGRRLVLDRPCSLQELGQRLKKHLGRARVQVASVSGPDDLQRTVKIVGVVPGAGAELAPAARAEGCDVFVTGEMKHHEVLAALHAGTSVVLAGHTNTERGYLARVSTKLGELLPGCRVIISGQDRDPLVFLP
ncbi:MAG: Nif3-like dinuclear metal center hexameric protein [Phycisphaerae bacterium]|nr:Nif3-like dinuclear metal center hexameric protein [Phycisphaerae bacterium]